MRDSEMDTYFDPNKDSLLYVSAYFQPCQETLYKPLCSILHMIYHHLRFLMWSYSVGGAHGSTRIKTCQALQFRPCKDVTMNSFRTNTGRCVFYVRCQFHQLSECERSLNTMRRLKTYLRSSMTSEQESGHPLQQAKQSTFLHGSIRGASFLLISQLSEQ